MSSTSTMKSCFNWPEREAAGCRPWWERAGRIAFAGLAGGSSHGPGRKGAGLIKRLKGVLGPTPGLPAARGNGQAVVCLTHDLDWAECWRGLEAVVEMELAAGVRSTINVLVRGPYTISRQLLADLQEEGFEIGLHGLWHDPALGMRSPQRIRDFLSRAVDELGMAVKGFRAPAFSYSPRLLLELARAGFTYDSSLAAWWKGVGWSPWRVRGLGIVELPVWGSDDRLLRERPITPEAAAGLLAGVARAGRASRPAVVNIHPGVALGFKGFFSNFLARVVASGARVVPAEVALGL